MSELSPQPGAVVMPNTRGSVKFAVIGDSGRGDRAQHDVARQMVAWRQQFPFDFVLMLGDNIYDSHSLLPKPTNLRRSSRAQTT